MQDTYTLCKDHLFEDETELARMFAPTAVKRILRIRSAYTLWLSFPNKKDAEIAQFIQDAHGVGKSQAYEDVRTVKNLLGAMNKASKDYHRWKFNQMFADSYEAARKQGDLGTCAKLQANYIKANNIAAEDVEENDWNKIEVQPFAPTTDPSVLGIKPLPNIQERIKKLRDKYFTDDIEAVEFEETEYNPDSLTKPRQEDERTE